jgi:prolyl 4-hydroxylase
MSGRPLTPDLVPQLEAWFEYNRSAGCSAAELKASLIEAGYREPDVDRFIDVQAARIVEDPRDADPVADATEAVARLWGRMDVLGAFNALSVGDRTVPILVKNPACGVFFIPGFLSEAECDELRAGAAGRLAPSTIVDEGDGAVVHTGERTSLDALLARGESETIRRIESRIARLTSVPVSHGEGLQVLRYDVGGEYRPHFDFFDPDTVGGAQVLARSPQRLATVILYLSDVEAGGGTRFLELSLEFTPMKGAALLFAAVGRDGAPLRTSLHAGAPVTSGDKWIATKWLRTAPYP